MEEMQESTHVPLRSQHSVQTPGPCLSPWVRTSHSPGGTWPEQRWDWTSPPEHTGSQWTAPSLDMPITKQLGTVFTYFGFHKIQIVYLKSLHEFNFRHLNVIKSLFQKLFFRRSWYKSCSFNPPPQVKPNDQLETNSSSTKIWGNPHLLELKTKLLH